MKHKKLIVFDIETVPDLEAAANLLGYKEDAAVLKQALTEYHLSITDNKNPFHRQLFHKVVAISVLKADIIKCEDKEYYSLIEIRSGGKLESEEKELVKSFFQYLNGSQSELPRLVSFNGRNFDLPVLKYRAMRHCLQVPWLYLSGDKWNNYNQRYSLDWHCDLIEAFSDFGTSAKVKMKEVCALFGLPGKLEVEGAMVDEMYAAGQLKEIRDYCELDVINTYLLYLRYAHHTAKISDSGFFKMIGDLQEWLYAEDKPHFLKFLDSWKELDKNRK